MPPESQTIVKLLNASKIFRTKGGKYGKGKSEVVALNQVNLNLDKGEIFGLVGESGSGKTTCGRVIVGLEDLDAGDLFLEGRQVTGVSASEFKKYRRMVQMVFQDPYQSLNPQISILDSVAEPLVTHKMGNAHERENLVVSILDQVGLSPARDFVYRFPHQLSGGQRQRVAIARAMILGPNCLVADEPTSMLDASYSAQIFEILLTMRKQYQTAILFITHSLAAARYLCDRIAVIYKGNIVEQGLCREVIENPCHPYTMALLDATPKFGTASDKYRHNTLLEKSVAQPPEGCVFFSRCVRSVTGKCDKAAPEWRQVREGHYTACYLASTQ